jgi:hypothetical protein
MIRKLMMKATIWFSVRLDAKRPMAIYTPPMRKRPRYPVKTGPRSREPRRPTVTA